MNHNVFDTPTIKAAVNRIIPEDEWPGGWAGGVGAYLGSGRAELDWARPLLNSLVIHLAQAALRDGARNFTELSAVGQDRIVETLTNQPYTAPLVAALRRLCWEGYYASSDLQTPVGLQMVGFRAIPVGVTPIERKPTGAIRSSQVASSYDAVIIGSGPGGGVAAQVLTQAGKRVLVVERAQDLPNSALRGDHLHGKRNAVYAPTAGPGAGHPRLAQSGDIDAQIVDGTGDAAIYGLNANAFGGGTRLWQGMAWRFMPEDFQMAKVYGNPTGASLVDWPITYDELEPFYAKAEHQLGVSGAQGGLTSRTPRSTDYPMPPMGTEPARELLGAAADSLGWGWGPIPLAINTVPHDGRAACVRCPQCVGHACPVDAKNGSHNTFIPRAIATGNCDLLFDAEVVGVQDGSRSARVSIMADTSFEPVELHVTADVIVVSAGAVESPRLLLASGIGNEHMGRYLHDHRFVTVLSDVDTPVKPFMGPGHSVATLDHVHAPSIPWGGGVLVDLMSLLPLTSASFPSSPNAPVWGLGHKQWMREGRNYVFGVFGMGQEVPVHSSRVAVEPSLRDRWGKPGAAIRKDVHWASTEVEDGMAIQGARWLEAAGARAIRRQRAGSTASAAGEHSCGTARMGNSPDTSATDRYGRPHGTRRIVVCDSSLHPTNGSVNPTLTIVANSFRVAEHLVGDWPR